MSRLADVVTKRNAEHASISPGIVIVPAYNEAANLPQVLADVQRYAPQVDLVVIDDASMDDTAAVAADLGARVIRLPCNLGYGGALQTGYKYAVERGYRFAVTLDADGQHDPADIPELLEPVLSGEADVAIGSRFLGSADYRMGWARRAGMRLFGAIVSLLTRRRVTDPTSGFQALNRKVLRFFAQDNYPVDYPDADTLLVLHYAGFCVTEVPVQMRQRLTGVSMHSSWRALYYVFKMCLAISIVLLRLKSRHRARYRPEQHPSTGHVKRI